MDTESQSPFPQQPVPRSGNIGALAAAVVIVLLLAVGGFYFLWAQQHGAQPAPQNAAQASAAPADTSTDSMQSDLNATQTTGGSGDVDNLNSAL